MAPIFLLTLLICSILLILSTTTTAQTCSNPKSLILPVSKDPLTKQYITHFSQRSPFIPLSLTLDIGGQFLWVDCDNNYSSSTFRPARCHSAQCSLARARNDVCSVCFNSPRPGCNNNTCYLIPDNSVIKSATFGQLATDVISLPLPSTKSQNPGKLVTIPNFLFVCGRTAFLEGLAAGVTGMAGLGRTKISLPSQFSSFFSFNRNFVVCLSSSTSSKGFVRFGNGPDVTKNLTYTPLIINPISTASAYINGDPSSEYFIGVTSIKVNGKSVPVNTTLLKIDKEANGGTKISSVDPYTVLETSIYKAVVNAFIGEISNGTRVASVAPFEACFKAKNIGVGVPPIDLVLQSESVFWRMFEANSMVKVSSDVICLGLVDGGVNPRTSIVIGGHQIEDNLLEFDLASSRLGFSSSLLVRVRQTTCANFNFTSIA